MRGNEAVHVQCSGDGYSGWAAFSMRWLNADSRFVSHWSENGTVLVTFQT